MNKSSGPSVNSSSETIFGRLWLARDVAALGNWIIFVALLVSVARFSDSPVLIGEVVTLVLLPRLLWPIVSRVVAWRNAVAFGMTAQIMRATVLLPAFFLDAEDGAQPLLIMAFVYALASPFFGAANQVLLRTVVGSGEYATARKTLLNTWLLILTLGPAFGYVIFGVAGLKSAAIATIVALLISAVMLLLSRPSVSPRGPEGDMPDLYSGFIPMPAGIVEAFRNPSLQQAAVVQIIAALLAGGLVVLEGAYATNGLFVGIENIGLLLAGQGVGMAIGGFWYQRLGKQYSFNALVAAGLALIGGGELGLSISSSQPAGIGLTAVIGLGIAIFGLSTSDLAWTTMSRKAPGKLPRIGVGTLIDAAIVISAAAMAPLCQHVTPRFAVVISGTLLCVLALYAFGEIPEPSPSAEEAISR